MSPDAPEASDGLTRALRIVAGITAASGAAQMVKPSFVLGELSSDHSPLARHLFGTVGMFMTVAGGALHRTLAVHDPDRRQLSWAAVEKLGAAVAVALGVRHRLFARRALLVASFDFFSAIACFALARRPLTTASEER